MTTMIYIRKPATRDLICYKGATLYDAFTFLDTADNPVNLTGWKARDSYWLRGSPDGTAATIALTSTPAAGITLGGAAGTVIITALPAATVSLKAGEYDRQFEFEDAAGAIQTYLSGTLEVREDIP